MIRIPFGIATTSTYRPGKPVRDQKYLKFIRAFPCVGCGRARRIEAMHTGPHGLGQKAGDDRALPGCQECHLELHAVGPETFQERRGISFEELIRFFNGLYEERKRRNAA